MTSERKIKALEYMIGVQDEKIDELVRTNNELMAHIENGNIEHFVEYQKQFGAIMEELREQKHIYKKINAEYEKLKNRYAREMGRFVERTVKKIK